MKLSRIVAVAAALIFLSFQSSHASDPLSSFSTVTSPSAVNDYVVGLHHCTGSGCPATGYTDMKVPIVGLMSIGGPWATQAWVLSNTNDASHLTIGILPSARLPIITNTTLGAAMVDNTTITASPSGVISVNDLSTAVITIGGSQYTLGFLFSPAGQSMIYKTWLASLPTTPPTVPGTVWNNGGSPAVY